MVIASPPLLTLTAYFEQDIADQPFAELEAGQLLPIPPASDRHQRITSLLFALLLQQGIPSQRLRMGMELVVTGARATVRIPDLTVLSEELALSLSGATRATITIDLPPPALVVEVVSPGKENSDRDYRYKRSEYGARGIPEYWIIDPQLEQIVCLEWVDGFYEAATYQGDTPFHSPSLGDLPLTAAQILAG
ncbi:Uma2 family endonuclease [Spirulina sp. CCNP1310]|uniref:Uma2 family endonuclease n=1 Tax=Spirulina sp. CCNP1310 TaxID=3110249 RepID=UPI002B21BE11|nr:Uma2 family endonuclease [Spirulina sp. CCNP1310]MEA5418441.1 Uma2 family endonuclease [Spirulina sp. CCNP1310]